jgi:MFS family permease
LRPTTIAFRAAGWLRPYATCGKGSPGRHAPACMTLPATASADLAGDQPAPARTGSLLVIFLTVFIDLLGFGMVLPLLPIYAKSFGVSQSGWEIALLMSSFSIMTFVFSPIWGRISDRIGRRPVLVVGLLGSVGFYLLFGLAAIYHSLTWLFVARIGAGICGATIPAAQAYIADTTTVETRARGMALIGAAFGLGFTFGPLLGAAALLATQSESQLETNPWPGIAAAILSAGALLLAIFLLPESLPAGPRRATAHWFFDMHVLADAMQTPSIPALLAVSFISVVSFGSFETTIPLLLKEKFGLAFHQVLLFFAYIGLVLSIAQGLLVRRLAVVLSEMTMASFGALACGAGFLLLAAASAYRELTLLMAAMAVEVVGFAFMTPSLQALISRRSDPERQGGILGISQGTSALARIVGPLIAIPLFEQVSPQMPYYVALGMIIGALVLLVFGARGGRDFEVNITAAGEP